MEVFERWKRSIFQMSDIIKTQINHTNLWKLTENGWFKITYAIVTPTNKI